MATKNGTSCELCSNVARMFCESDQASLCWECDQKVHSANFLVAKHSRTLLCHVCHAPTPWTAAGQNLGPTVSLCRTCATRHNGRTTVSGLDVEEYSQLSQQGDDESESGSDYSTSASDDEEEKEEEEEEEGENQVVPLSQDSSSIFRPFKMRRRTTSSDADGVFTSPDRTEQGR